MYKVNVGCFISMKWNERMCAQKEILSKLSVGESKESETFRVDYFTLRRYFDKGKSLQTLTIEWCNVPNKAEQRRRINWSTNHQSIPFQNFLHSKLSPFSNLLTPVKLVHWSGTRKCHFLQQGKDTPFISCLGPTGT